MSVQDFVTRAMHADVLFQRGSPQRLSLLEEPLGAYDLEYLFAHGEEATVWRDGGLQTTRGYDSERDLAALVPGVTVQTHLQGKLTFGRRLISSLARQMQMKSGFFTIFASLDTRTAAHFDRNYNFTIQLRGEKTWAVHTDGPGIPYPSANLAFDVDHLAPMQPQLHGTSAHEPSSDASIHHLQPGDILYVPPGYWHATECVGLSLSLNLSLEPWAWFQVLGDALLRHLEAQPAWRAPRGVPTREEAAEYLADLNRIVDSIAVEDLVADSGEPSAVQMDEPLRRTLGSLLMWDKKHAGLHYGTDELRFLAKGTRGSVIDTLKADWEPVLVLLARLDRPMTVRDLSTTVQLDGEQMRDFVHRLLRVGYLTAARSASIISTEG